MPLPLILGVAGLVVGAKGVKKAVDTHSSLNAAKYVQQQNVARFEEHKKSTEQNIRDLENIIYSVEKLIKDDFVEIRSKLQSEPTFKDFKKSGICIPEYYGLSSISDDITIGIAIGTGQIAFASVFGGALLGGLLIGVLGSSLEKKEDEAWDQVFRTEKEINKICSQMDKIDTAVNKYWLSIKKVKDKFLPRVNMLKKIVFVENRVDFNDFNQQEKLMCENTYLLAFILNDMIRIQLTKDDEINYEAIDESIANANEFLQKNDLETDLQ